MKKGVIIDGGAGRVIAAIPSLIKYKRKNPSHDLRIFVSGWDTLLWGIPELHSISFSTEIKGIFESRFKDLDILISPEPYRLPSYYNQKISLSEAFDEIINETHDHSDLDAPVLVLNKMEEKQASVVIGQAKRQYQKQKTIVIQPFGRSAQRIDERDIVDDSSRSLEPQTYLKLVKKLSAKYNLIFFGEKNFQVPGDDSTFKPEIQDLRGWAAVIEACDYFIGCDSVGQHIARAFNKPGTVIIGSTFAVNTTYPNFFNIYEKKDVQKTYSPIRISQFESHLADRYNDRAMEFSDQEINELYKLIVEDIEKKIKF